MWNVAVSIISPIYSKPVNLWHDKTVPDIVIIANGGGWLSEVRPCTHFSATRWKDEHKDLIGAELLQDRHHATIAQDEPPRTLNPILLTEASKARSIALKEYMDTDKERSLKLLRGTCVQIKNLEEEIVKKIGETEALRDQKKLIEYKLEKLGIATEKIEEYGKLQDSEYCRLSEHKKKNEENERRRKREEEEKELEASKKHVVSVGEGEVVISIPDEGAESKEYEDK